MDLKFNSFWTSVGTILNSILIGPVIGLAGCGRPVETWKVDLGKELVDRVRDQ